MPEPRRHSGCAIAGVFTLLPLMVLGMYHRIHVELREAGAGDTTADVVRYVLIGFIPVAVVGGILRGRYPLHREKFANPVSGVTVGLVGTAVAGLLAPTAKVASYAVGCVVLGALWEFGVVTLLSRAVHRLGGWGRGAEERRDGAY